MSVLVITPPQPIVSLAEAKRQLRYEDDDQDDLVQDLVAAATATIDGPGGWLGRALGQQTLELRSCGFGSFIELRYPPIVSVTSVRYLDGEAAEQPVAPESYFLDGARYVRAVAGWSAPLLAGRSDAVRVRYVAGWPMSSGDNPRWTGPAPVRLAILMMVARLFAARGEDRPGSLVEDPAVGALLAPWRVWQV